MVEWPEGLSDGLVLPCASCGRGVRFDFTVSDKAWKRLVPVKWHRSVLCLACFDACANAQSVKLSDCVEKIQFAGLGQILVLSVSEAWNVDFEDETPPEKERLVDA